MKITLSKEEVDGILREHLGLQEPYEIEIDDDLQLKELFINRVYNIAVTKNKKISAIKYFRVVTARGPSDSKKAVENIMEGKTTVEIENITLVDSKAVTKWIA